MRFALPVLIALILAAPAAAKRPAILGTWDLEIHTRYCHGFGNCGDEDGNMQRWRITRTWQKGSYRYTARYRTASTGRPVRLSIRPKGDGWVGRKRRRFSYRCQSTGEPATAVTGITVVIHVRAGYMVLRKDYWARPQDGCPDSGPVQEARGGDELTGGRADGTQR